MPKRGNAPTMHAMDNAFRERAAQRRVAWAAGEVQGGKVNIAEADDFDSSYWHAMSPAERFLTVWTLSYEAYGEPHGTSPGLRGSTGGIRRL